MATAEDHRYHHGDLRRAIIDGALEAIERDGPAGMSLRDLARRAGVSHAAPAHHFGDKTGLLTAIATEGFEMLADDVAAAFKRTGSFLEVGVAYVGFAVRHPAHFAVMFRPELLRLSDPALAAARERAWTGLYGPLDSAPLTSDANAELAGIAAWSLVHGLATLYLAGNLPPSLGDDPEAIARAVAANLFPSTRGR